MLKILFFFLPLFGLWSSPPIYNEIRDLKHPTWFDYKKIQKYLKKGDREELKRLQQAIEPGGTLYDYDKRMRRFSLVGKWPWQGAKFKIIPFQCSPEDKKICVVSYASYNKHYPRGIEEIKKCLKKVGFKGHFIYRIGGWPDLEEGSLKLAHVPYAFKPCFIKEVQRMGYESVIWLDASIRPMKSLDPLLKTLEAQGYFFYLSGHTLAPYCTREVMGAMNEPVENAKVIPSVAAGLFGLNLRHPLGAQLLDSWYRAALQETPFFSPRPDQNPLSVLAYQMKMTQWETSGLDWEECKETTQFFIDWKSIQ